MKSCQRGLTSHLPSYPEYPGKRLAFVTLIKQEDAGNI